MKKLIKSVLAAALFTMAMNATLFAAPKQWTHKSVPSIYETYKDKFDYVGLAASYGNFGMVQAGENKYTAYYVHQGWGNPQELYFDEVREGLKKHINTLTTGNELKPQFLLAWWKNGDGARSKLVDFTASNGKTIKVPEKLNSEDLVYAILNCAKDMGVQMRGHVLTWHSQTPDDFFAENYKATVEKGILQNPVDKETMTARHEWYIKTVLGYVDEWEKANGYGEGNRIIWAWDVVNEACADDATDTEWLRGSTPQTKDKSPTAYPQGSRWYQIYGDDEFIVNAFRFANAYAPSDVKLCYNDYNEYMGKKTNAICKLIKNVQNGAAKNVNGKSVKPRIDVMGMQSHVGISFPSTSAYEAALKKFLELGVDIHVTELDFSATSQEAAAKAYTKYFQMLQKYGKDYEGKNKITCVTIWGICNEDSWINPNSKGQKTYPLLFTKKNNSYFPNESFTALIDAHN